MTTMYDGAIEALEGLDRMDLLSQDGKEELLRLKNLRRVGEEL